MLIVSNVSVESQANAYSQGLLTGKFFSLDLSSMTSPSYVIIPSHSHPLDLEKVVKIPKNESRR